jgi:hypothetical protein
MQLRGSADSLRPFNWNCVSGLLQFLTANQKHQRVNVCAEKYKLTETENGETGEEQSQQTACSSFSLSLRGCSQ